MDSMLGKRKEREEDATQIFPHGSTLFVSNLPYTATSVDLQTLFSDIAPIRSAFVATEQGTGVSKGVGYVAFAIKEDAESAFAKIFEEGIKIAGRKLRVEWANQKPKERGEKEPGVKKETKPRPAPRISAARVTHDPLAIRTIIVSGLPGSIDSKTLWKKIRKYKGAEKLVWPIKGDNDEDDPTIAHVLFDGARTAGDAVNKLHAHVYKGCLLSVTLKRRLESLAKPINKAKKDTEKVASLTTTAPSHASRLIIRNLPFNATEQDLRALFLPYGPIHSIHIPKSEENEVKPEDAESSQTALKRSRTKGFAFVWMLSKQDAEKAIGGCNGKTVRAGMAETLVSDKQKRKKQKRLEKKSGTTTTTVPGAEGEDEDEEMEGPEKAVVDDKRATERVIAVDWALSKDKWKEEKAKLEELAQDQDEEMDDVSGSGSEESDSDSKGSDSGSDEGGLGVHEEDDDDDDDEEDRSGDEAPVRPQLPPPETGTTLFIRNVPFAATEDELRTLFRAFGPLRYARITMDPATGRSRGTGFACFWNKEDADKVVEQSDMLRAETTGLTSLPKKNPFSLPSILTPDPSSSLAQTLVLHGRTLDVVRAVTRDVAGKLKEEGEKMREKQDKRNIYLLREGVVMPNSTAAVDLTPAEIERRTSSYNSRRALLKSNPSLFISRTRLSVRQIPIFVTERMLKRLAMHALKAFQADVKAGTRTALSADELAERTDTDLDEIVKEEETEKAEKDPKKKRFTGRDTGVKQTKVVRQAERVDPVTGKGRSKGYGFLEMHKHADSLRVLRWSNNNPDVGPLFEEWWKDELQALLKQEKAKEEKDEARIKRIKEEIESGSSKKSKGTLIVEFSIENIQVVQRRSALQKDKSSHSADAPVLAKQAPKETPDTEQDAKPSKRLKLSKDAKSTKPAKEESAKPFSGVGALIGRKRKERKSGKKGGK